MTKRVTEILALLHEEVRTEVTEAGLDPDKADRAAARVVERFCHVYAGNRVYVPINKQASKRREVLEDFDGTNHDEVCRKHRITRRTLYRYLNAK
jgi:Mor family transcriptional regulator